MFQARALVVLGPPADTSATPKGPSTQIEWYEAPEATEPSGYHTPKEPRQKGVPTPKLRPFTTLGSLTALLG